MWFPFYCVTTGCHKVDISCDVTFCKVGCFEEKSDDRAPPGMLSDGKSLARLRNHDERFLNKCVVLWWIHCHVIRVAVQPISIRKAQSRKEKKPIYWSASIVIHKEIRITITIRERTMWCVYNWLRALLDKLLREEIKSDADDY